MAKSTKAAAPKKRRSPISRAEGEQRLIDAATQLVRERPFSEVGVREIAVLADVNHGFVHTWFGSKNDLLLRVVRNLLDHIIEDIRNSPAGQQVLDPFNTDVALIVRLVIWLNLEGVPVSGILNELPIVAELAHRYESTEGIDPSISRAAALHAVALGIGTSSFSPMLSADRAKETTLVYGLWRHILGLLAKYPPA